MTSVFLFVSSLKLRRIHFPYILLTGHTWPRQSSGSSQGLAPNRWCQPSLVPTSGTDTFPEQDVERLRPTLVSSWKTIGESQSVSWRWAMVMAISLCTVRDPTAVLMPTTTIEVCPVLWAFMIHPGSTYTLQFGRFGSGSNEVGRLTP